MSILLIQQAFALKSYLYKHEESSCMRLHRNLAAFKRDACSPDNLITDASLSFMQTDS